MKKLLIGGVSVVALAAGSVAVAAVSPIEFAGANGAPAVQMQAGQVPSTTVAGQAERKGRKGGLEKVLEGLVSDGTMTQAQADKVMERVRAARDQSRFGRKAHRGHALSDIAQSIGITEEQLKTELRSGKSVAEVAQAHGVDPQKVINDLVAASNKKIDEAVASGKLSAERAAKIKERLTERITNMVNAKHGPRRDGNKQRRQPGQPGQPGQPAQPGNESTTTAPPTSQAPTTEAPTTEAPTTTAPAPTSAPTTEAPRSPTGSAGDGTSTTTG